MKILTYKENGINKWGIKTESGIISVEKVTFENKLVDIPQSIDDLLLSKKDIHQMLNQIIALTSDEDFMQESELNIQPAIQNPKKIICVGLNYKKHADETKSEYPEYPILFNKFSNALSGHKEKVVVPKTTKRLDYEVELGIIIGEKGKNIKAENALDYVFGYATTNDLSARDLQKRSGQWMLGKISDGFAPVGPYIVTKDEVPNPNDLKVTTHLNGELRQDSNTSDMIFSCEEIISYISEHMTLEPGDLIMTGTPEGVILGRPMEKRVYMVPGDEVTVEVEGLGILTTYFI